jgi:thiopurine S-methyltransferase
VKKEQEYWTRRYQEDQTGWDIGYTATPIKEYIDQLTDDSLKILIPGAGNAFEAEYLWKNGFRNVHILDISEVPLNQFKERNPDFPEAQIHQADFFEHSGTYELIIEQTFFCSMFPTDANRSAYAKHISNLLQPNGKLVGVWFDFPLIKNSKKRPFGGDKKLYISYLSPYLNTKTFERCTNSIPPRQGNELFGIFLNK